MDPYLLDSFAAHSVGRSLADYTLDQRVPRGRPVPPRRPRRHRLAATLGTTLGVAAPALAVVVVIAR